MMTMLPWARSGASMYVGVAAVPSVRRCCEKWVGMTRCRCGAKLLLSLGGCRGQLVGARLLRDLWTTVAEGLPVHTSEPVCSVCEEKSRESHTKLLLLSVLTG